MAGTGSQGKATLLSNVAYWLAGRTRLPTAVRAVMGYYADTGVFDYRSMRLKSQVDDEISQIIDDAFGKIESNLEDEFAKSRVTFEYGTKLTLPAELTLGYIYRKILNQAPADFNPITREETSGISGILRRIFDTQQQPQSDEQLRQGTSDLIKRAERADQLTKLVVEALIDGDMRDALNDEEYGDFSVDFPVEDTAERRRIAEIAQETLETSIQNQFPHFPDAVRDAYTSAVEISEAHQTEDEAFRELMTETDSNRSIRDDYKFASFDTPPDIFPAEIIDLPYFKTQYDRVGVIYDGMIDMYRGAGFEINDDFKRSIVLAIIGAQIWLDDVDDYVDDREEGQLTPVTAEYVLAETDQQAYSNIITLVERYISKAKQYASDSGTPLTGIAIEYIYRDGDPSGLPR